MHNADLLATWQTLIQKHGAATETAEIGQALLTSWREPQGLPRVQLTQRV